MIVYKNTAIGFRKDVEENGIAEKITAQYKMILGRTPPPSEQNAFRNSMNYMERVIRNSQVADNCGILIEYVIPTTSNRIDFLISGHDENNQANFVIIELKQWQNAEATDQDGIIKTAMGGSLVSTTHPSYQANSYQSLLNDFNEEVYNGNISPLSCAYLHNYQRKSPEPLLSVQYNEIIKETPVFFSNEAEKLQDFLKKYVGKGNGEEILYKIEHGKIKPSKKLIDHVCNLLKGNKSFTLIDEQKVAYEEALSTAKYSKKKSVIIIKGGPGTGKSVVSMNLLGGIIKLGKNVVFVAPNAAYRSVIVEKLKKENKKSAVDHLFKGSAGFVDTTENEFDVIIVDEAHRLKNSTAYQYYGKNQVEDIVKSAKISIFFVDESQMIRPEDIGSIEEIERVASVYEAEVTVMELMAQYRCSGADGYINWLDDTLHIRETANYDGWDEGAFDFQIFDSPNELKDAIDEKIIQGEDARIVAGYSWKWTGIKQGNADSEVADVSIEAYDFKMPWNSRKVGSRWALADVGKEQIGCIHTVQGLEFDYIGVIVGRELSFDFSSLTYIANWNAYKDNYGKKGLKDNPKELSKLIRNIYKVLMTRGMKGCYVFFEDESVKKYFLSRM
jgi:hypothetical protein